MFVAALLTAVGVYFAAAMATAYVARRPLASEAPSGEETDPPFVSVIVAARDEEARLPACLRALLAQTYERYEVLVADDHSSDRTREVAAEHGIRCIAVPEGQHGKAAAIHAAVSAARGEVLAVTDADCRPPNRWLAHLAGVFRGDDIGVVCGVTAVTGSSLLSRIQAMDWTLLLTVAAGLSKLGWPLTAMGNNMAFRREAYEAVGGYPQLPASVTEDYTLFRAVRRRTRWRVDLALEGGLMNVTLPLGSLDAVIRQRRRWARGGLRADPWAYAFYGIVYAAHMLIVAGLFVAPIWALGALTFKLIGDAVVLHVGGRQLGQRHLRPSLLLFELYLFGYILTLPILLALAPRIRWRGRSW